MDESRLPVKLAIGDAENRKTVQEFFRQVNKKIINKQEKLDPKLAMRVVDLTLLLACGVSKEQINRGVYRQLRGYVLSNMGPCKIQFGYNGEIDRIQVGSLEITSLYSEDIDYDSIEPKPINLSYGTIPTSKEPDSLNLCINNQPFVGIPSDPTSRDVELQRNNVKFGEYYFSRKNILAKNQTAELVRFDRNGPADEMIQTIEVYDKAGNMNPMTHVDQFTKIDGSYHLLSQSDLIDIGTLNLNRKNAKK